MTIKISTFDLNGHSIELHRKKIKNMHLRVLRPNGKVRVSAPLRVAQRDIAQFVGLNDAWIREIQARIAALPAPIVFKYSDGEQHYLLGRAYLIKIEPTKPKQPIDDDLLLIRIKDGSTAQKEKALSDCYRATFKSIVPAMLVHWQAVVGQSPNEWQLRKMKNKWGSCNIRDRRVWLNLELIKYPKSCIEYVLVHELVHLYERYHNARFYGFMDQFLPDWKTRKDQLNTLAL
ncbi:MAG: putative metal-dependent hydrolase [Flavobacteriales bacterium]|jgi:predicted metal-dependent hydrolase